MKHPTYLFDFKNITNPAGIEEVLSHWTCTKLSDRTFEVSGREYTKRDLLLLYQCIGRDGHIFIFDCENGGEYYLPKFPKSRRKTEARDFELDAQTLLGIEQQLDSRAD